jgi:Calcineurin-like phosphoesterase
MRMSKVVLVVPDQHVHKDYHNDRADWLGKLILDLKPDVLVNMGDACDLPSLSGYDKGKASFNGASYQKDIEAHLDFQERMWAPIKTAKRKKPHSIILWGNHENRLNKVLEYEPQLRGDKFGLSPKNFEFEEYYHEVVPYEGQTPGIYNLDGVLFSHYFVSGLMGRPIGGVNHAASLISKNHCSSVAAHSHTFDFSVVSKADGGTVMGLVCGVYQDYESKWAGTVNNLWQSGVAILKDFEGGRWDLEWVGIKRMKALYG